MLYPLEIMTCVRSVASGEFYTCLFLIEMLATLQSLFPRDIFLQDNIPQKFHQFQKSARKCWLRVWAKQTAYLNLLLSFSKVIERKTLWQISSNFMGHRGHRLRTLWCVGTSWADKLVFKTEKAAYIKRHVALVSLSMQCLFTPTLISRSESCEYHMVASHFSKLLCEWEDYKQWNKEAIL